MGSLEIEAWLDGFDKSFYKKVSEMLEPLDWLDRSSLRWWIKLNRVKGSDILLGLETFPTTPVWIA